MTKTKTNTIDGVIIKGMRLYKDERGYLSEGFRHDEIDKSLYPAMSYISITHPGIARGPHEHIEQTDFFCFPGPSTFELCLWDNRKNSPTYRENITVKVGENNPTIAIIPPGVVHAYKNIGDSEGLVINFPNRLFAGWNKKEKVDEIRHENDADSLFKIEEAACKLY